MEIIPVINDHIAYASENWPNGVRVRPYRERPLRAAAVNPQPRPQNQITNRTAHGHEWSNSRQFGWNRQNTNQHSHSDNLGQRRQGYFGNQDQHHSSNQSHRREYPSEHGNRRYQSRQSATRTYYYNSY